MTDEHPSLGPQGLPGPHSQDLGTPCRGQCLVCIGFNRAHAKQHYKSNTWVAGYNPLNEPTDIKHTRLIDFYVRIEKAIRAIDPIHVLFLE